LEYNFRLACNQGVKFGHLNPEFAGFYEFQLLEEINSIAHTLGIAPIFPDVPSISSYKDTGERFCLRANVLEGESETKTLVPFFNSDDNATKSTTFMNYADLLDKDPTVPIKTDHEIAKFAESWMRYQNGENINFTQMATDWNVDYYLMKSGNVEAKNIKPKSTRDLQRYYKTTTVRENTYHTMAPHHEASGHLSASHRSTVVLNSTLRAEASLAPVEAPKESLSANLPTSSSSKLKCVVCGHDWKSPTYKAFHKTGSSTLKGKKECDVDQALRRSSELVDGGCVFLIGTQRKKCTKRNDHWHSSCAEKCCN
jgi:hypothetical protein